jgi:hypothetical protein
VNKTLVTLLAIGIFPLAGAEPCKMVSGKKEKKLNTAQCYAHELAKLSSDYLAVLEVQVSAQQDVYDRLAGLYSSTQRANENLALEDDRDKVIQLWISHLADDTMRLSFVLDDVVRVATKEFQATRAQHEQDLDGKAAILGTLNNLEVDTKKIAGLADLFNDLAQPPDLKAWVSDLATYGQGVQSQIKLASCALASSRLGFFTSESTRLAGLLAKPGLGPDQSGVYAAQKQAADDQVTALQAEVGKCPAPLPPQ